MTKIEIMQAKYRFSSSSQFFCPFLRNVSRKLPFRIINGRVIGERIVGGEVVRRGTIPYIVSLLWSGSHFCGGTILDESTILTAAHCLYGYEDDPYIVVAGEWSLSKNDTSEQYRDVSRVVVHEGYNDRTFENDVALMFVSPPFQFNTYIQNVTLPSSMHSASGPANVSGWGVEEEGGENLSDKLKRATLQIVDDETCREELGGNPGQVYESMICAYHPPGGTDSCQGDSGGPLMAFDTGSEYQAGIVSWGYGCARPGVPGMYTEVSHFIDWITENRV